MSENQSVPPVNDEPPERNEVGVWGTASQCVGMAAGATIGAIVAACIAYFAFGTVSVYARPYEAARAATNFSAFMALAGLLSVGSTIFGFRAFYLVAKRIEALAASKSVGV